MADEKKIALVIQLKADGQGKAQEVTANLKSLGAAHDGAAKKAKDHGAAMVDLTRKILGLISIKEVIKVIKDVSRALVEMVQQAVAFQSEFAPLRVAFESAASKIKTSFASITTSALPAVTLLQQVLGDALGDMANFVNANREIIATDLAGWAADGARFLLSAFSFAVNAASKSINGLLMAYHEAASFISFVQGDDKGADLHEGKAAKALSDMEGLDAKMASIEKRVGGYIDKAQKFASEQAKKPVKVIDPEEEAKRTAEFDHQLGLRLAMIQRNGNTTQAIEQALVLQHDVFEEKKRSSTVARMHQEQVQLLAISQLIHQLETKQGADAAALAELKKKYSDGVAEAQLANLQRVAEQEERDQDRRNALRDRELADANDKVGRMSAGFEKAQGFMSLITQIESERRMAMEKGNVDRAAKLEEDSIQARKSAFAEYYEGVREVVGGVVDAAKTLIKAGVDGTRDMGQVAIGIAASIGEAVLDKLLGMFVGFITEQIANLLLKGVAQSAIGAAAGAANITANAAVAASAAIAATAAIPVLGPALAPAAGAAAFTEAMAYLPIALGSAVAMATGGLVLGGAAGLDSVPAMLMPGEFVVPAAQVRQNVAAGRAPDDSGASGGRGGGGAVNINVSQQSFVPGTKADFQRSVREAVLPAIRQLARQGLLVLK